MVSPAASACSANRRAAALRCPAQQGLRQPKIDQQRDQFLLRTVVNVAFQALPLGVLPGDQVAAGRAQLGAASLQLGEFLLEFGAQAGHPQNQGGLGGQAGEEALLDGCQPLPVTQDDRQCTQ